MNAEPGLESLDDVSWASAELESSLANAQGPRGIGIS